MRPTYSVKKTYIGAGNQKFYTFDFKIIDKSQLNIVHTDENDVVVFSTNGADLVNIPSVVFNSAGGTIELTANLPVGHKLAIYFADDMPIQPQRFANGVNFRLEQIENALDRITGPLQKLFYWMKRVPKISDNYIGDFDGTIPKPVPENVMMFNAAADGYELIHRSQFVGDQGPIGPQGPSGQIVALNVVGELEYDDVTPMSATNSGTLEAAIIDFVLRKGPKGDSAVVVTVSDQPPDNGVGENGDLWFFIKNGDVNNGNVYQKNGGIYTLKGNIQGPPGGVDSIEGATGSVTFEMLGIRNGVTFIPNGQNYVDVAFPAPRADANYVVTHTFENLVDDPNDLIWLIGTITNKTVNGFRVNLIAPVDTGNYTINWEVKRMTV